MTIKYHRVGQLVLLLSLTTITVNSSASPTPAHYVKAGMVFSFISFTQWPKSIFMNSETPYSICVLRKSTYLETFKSISSRKVNNRNIRAIEIDNNADPESLKKCHILLLKLASNRKIGAQLLRSASKLPILTIQDNYAPFSPKAMIQFQNYKGKIRFIVNRGIARDRGFDFRSKMLRLAAKVEE